MSFLNLTTPGRASLGMVDAEMSHFHAVALPEQMPRSNGVTGIAFDSTCIYAVGQSPPAIIALDIADLSLKWRHDLTRALDVHSILLEGDTMFVVSTGTDEVLELRISESGVTAERVLWRPDREGPRWDMHHLNSLCRWHGDLLVSGFGRQSGTGWSTAFDGFVHNITRDERILSRLRNPHSLTLVDDRIFFCESALRSVRALENDRVSLLPGYTRGLCIAGGHLFAGTSKRRLVSKSTGKPVQGAADGQPEPQCTISRLAMHDLTVERTLDLGSYAMEIYELLPVGDPSAWPIVPGSGVGVSDWWEQVELAIHDIARVIPRDSKVLVVDENRWGSLESVAGSPRLCMRKPASGAMAVEELERIRGDGATHLVLAWSSFWWLDYYPELRDHLRGNYLTTLENDRVMVFDVRRSSR